MACPDLVVTRATADDLMEIVAILAEVRQWMLDRGILLWAPPFTAAWIRQKMADGEFYVGRCAGVPLATMRLLWSDAAVWGELERGDAAYIHTLAVAAPSPDRASARGCCTGRKGMRDRGGGECCVSIAWPPVHP